MRKAEGLEKMREIIIKLTDEQYGRIIRVCNKRNKSPGSMCKHMLLQLADNDEIEAVTGKRRSDSSVVKRQRYRNQRRKRHENWADRY